MVSITTPLYKTLFEATLEPSLNALEEVKKNTGRGELKAFFRKKNKVAIGRPYFEDLVSRIITKGKAIPHEINQLLKSGYAFYYLSLSCSFLPDKDCKYSWTRFGIELNAEETDEQPIAYDVFPREVLTEIKCKTEGRLTPQLKFDSKVISTNVKIGKSETTEFISYEPQLFAFGVKTSQVVWDFKSTKEKGIWGDKTGLNIIIKAPKDKKIKGKFVVSAEVETYLGKWIRIPLIKKRDDLATAEYILSDL